jgi:hypothetical protein
MEYSENSEYVYTFKGGSVEENRLYLTSLIKFFNQRVYGDDRRRSSFLSGDARIRLNPALNTFIGGAVECIDQFIVDVRAAFLERCCNRMIKLADLQQKWDIYFNGNFDSCLWSRYDYSSDINQLLYIIYNLVDRIIETLTLFVQMYRRGMLFIDDKICCVGGGPCLESELFRRLYLLLRGDNLCFISVDPVSWDYSFNSNIVKVKSEYSPAETKFRYVFLSYINGVVNVVPEILMHGARFVLSIEGENVSRPSMSQFCKARNDSTKIGWYCDYIPEMKAVIEIGSLIREVIPMYGFYNGDPVYLKEVVVDVKVEKEVCVCDKTLWFHDVNFMIFCIRNSISYERCIELYCARHFKGDVKCHHCRNIINLKCIDGCITAPVARFIDGINKDIDAVDGDCTYCCTSSKLHYICMGTLYRHVKCVGYSIQMSGDPELWNCLRYAYQSSSIEFDKQLVYKLSNLPRRAIRTYLLVMLSYYLNTNNKVPHRGTIVVDKCHGRIVYPSGLFAFSFGEIRQLNWKVYDRAKLKQSIDEILGLVDVKAKLTNDPVSDMGVVGISREVGLPTRLRQISEGSGVVSFGSGNGAHPLHYDDGDCQTFTFRGDSDSKD